MKPLAAVLGGFFLTLMVFVGGAAVAVLFLTAKPGPSRPLTSAPSVWSNHAVAVNRTAQDYERLPARPSGDPAPAANEATAATFADTLTTATTSGAQAEADAREQTEAAADQDHVQWCLDQYRSYDPSNDSYMAYSGVRRRCVSPDETAAEMADPQETGQDPLTVSAGADDPASGYLDPAYAAGSPGAAFNSDHAQSCLDRYRSYRVEDNTYQPYGGGPRRQCE